MNVVAYGIIPHFWLAHVHQVNYVRYVRSTMSEGGRTHLKDAIGQNWIKIKLRARV